MITAVEKSFNELSTDYLDKVFLSLQMCMAEVIKSFGNSTYKLPHIGKSHLAHNEMLPINISCDVDVIQQATVFLQTQ